MELTVTARHVYVRAHGPSGRYEGRYPDDVLKTWAQEVKRWRRQKRDVYCFFDNDQKSAAPLDAERLVELVFGKERRRQAQEQ